MHTALRRAVTGVAMAAATLLLCPPVGASRATAPPTTEVNVKLANWLAGKAPVSWTPVPGTPTYDVRLVNPTALSTKPGPWKQPGWLQGITRTTAALSLGNGTVLCVSVRVHLGGVTGPWSARDCVTRAFGIKPLTKTGNVTQVADTLMWGKRALVTHGKATVRLDGVPAGSQVGAIVTHPAATRTFQLLLEHTVVGVGFSEPTDEQVRNLAFLASDTAPRTSRLVYSTDTGNGQSFPLQGLYVLPPWLVAP